MTCCLAGRCGWQRRAEHAITGDIGDGLLGRAGSSAAVRHDGTRARRSISAIRPVGVPPKWSPPEVRGGDWLPPGSSSRSFRRGPAVAIVVRAVHGRTACRGHQAHHDHHRGCAVTIVVRSVHGRTAGRGHQSPSSRGESHPPALTDPNVNLSVHSARAVQSSGRVPQRPVREQIGRPLPDPA